jgi:hypothetical protein
VSRRVGIFAALLLAFSPGAFAQIVPLSRCQAAIPCSIPFGLRPADAVAFSPYARTGNAGLSVSAGVEEGLKPKLDRVPISEDPSERAARIFVKRNPYVAKPTPTPTPHVP